jgi:hypothetical protein
VKQGQIALASTAADLATTSVLVRNPRTKIGSSKIERNTSTHATWLERTKEDAEDAVVEAAAVVDEAVVVAVVGAVVEDDLISPLPSPKKTTNVTFSGNHILTTLPPSVGTRRHKELLQWHKKTQRSPLSHALRMSYKIPTRMTTNARKP